MKPEGTLQSPTVKALTANRKKKLRQKRAKASKRAAQSGEPSASGGRLSTLEDDSTTASSVVGWRYSGIQSAGLPCDEDASAASSAHAFNPVGRQQAHPPAQCHSLHSKSWAAADRAARADGRVQSDQAASTSADWNGVAGAGSHTARDGAADGSSWKRRLPTFQTGAKETADTLSGDQLSGTGSAGQQADGGRTDMTAALLVMQAALARPPPQPSASGQRPDVAVHGNYKRYYGYRLGGAEDPRLQVLERNWFAGKRCLDVGCNEGLVTLAVATKFGSAAMLGLDIDADLVQRACASLSREHGDVAKRLTAMRLLGSDCTATVRELLVAQRALKGVWFQQGNMASGQLAVEPGSVDTALCLSVTKWVHINAGDAGLKALFAALHAALRPGGLLVLEPQPWRSYKQALRKQELAASLHGGMLAALELRPGAFPVYLQREAGFRLVRQLQKPSVNKGFDRPMYLLEKLAE